MSEFRAVFGSEHPIIAMLHLRALPGTPGFAGDVDAVYTQVLQEARFLAGAGVHGLLLENFGDVPYTVGTAESVQVATMAAVGREIRQAVPLPLGVNVQFNAWREEVALATAIGAAFVRAEAFVETRLTAQGWAYPCSAELMRELTRLRTRAAVFADLQVKETIPLVPIDTVEIAQQAVAAGARALIVTGSATGELAGLETLSQVRLRAGVPVLAGSGVSAETVAEILRHADGVIVGSSLKADGVAANPVAEERVRKFMAAVQAAVGVR